MILDRANPSNRHDRTIDHLRPLAADVPAVALSPGPGEFPVFLRDGRTLALVRGRQLVVRPWRENAGRFERGGLAAAQAMSLEGVVHFVDAEAFGARQVPLQRRPRRR